MLAVRLDALGSRAGREVRVYDPGTRDPNSSQASSVLELSAAVAGGKIAVLWVDRDGLEMPVRAAIGDTETLMFGAPSSVAEGLVEGMHYRGHVAVAGADDGSFVGIYRGADRPCEERAPSQCAGFGVQTLRATGSGESRVPLAVPSPCRRSIAGITARGDRLYYGLCAESDGRSATTVYTIARSPEYARSDRTLEGCAPIGATVVGDTTWFVGQCGERRRVARFEPESDTPTNLEVSGGAIRCEGGNPVIPLGDELAVPLTSPMDRLDPMLPPVLADLGARAVWTGESMLLAVSLGREVAIHRYQCEDGEFLRTDIL
ncbi:MAG: hypothetical protein H5U40_04930 [Polyangiaceae bacterium]|nr:hypothetical protein [Polyangiaceae bacterium]